MSNDESNNASKPKLSKSISSDNTLSEESNETLVPVVVRLRLWSNGFTIENGPLRLYENPENADFLASILRDEYPAELLVYGKNIEVSVEERITEKYGAIKSIEFEGSGHRLGSPTPSLRINKSVAATEVELSQQQEVEVVELTEEEIYALAGIKFNANQPMTNIQIRLANGTRLMTHFNLSNTIQDIYAYVQHARPEYAAAEFILMTTHPRVELINKKLTLEKAGLRNVLLTQRISGDD